MRILLKMLQFVSVALLLVSCPALSAQYAEAQNTKAQNDQRPIRNIVLVHGAWADGSGWKSVYDILVKEGFNVSIVQEPETSFKEDVAATKRVIALQRWPMHPRRSQLWRSRDHRSWERPVSRRFGLYRGSHAGCRRE